MISVNNTFNQISWRSLCETALTRASARCGSSYEYGVVLFSEEMDWELDEVAPEHHEAALKVLRAFGYRTRDEREEDEAQAAAAGYCVHGLDWLTCPCGCFED